MKPKMFRPMMAALLAMSASVGLSFGAKTMTLKPDPVTPWVPRRWYDPPPMPATRNKRRKGKARKPRPKRNRY